MAQYTTTISRFVMNQQNITHMSIPLNTLIQNACTEIFDFQFTWFNSDAQSLQDFERLFVLHFWEQEIGYETWGLFKLKLQELFLKRLPVWQMWYDSQKLIQELTEGNPLYNRLSISSSQRDLIDDDIGKQGGENTLNVDQGTLVNSTRNEKNSGSDTGKIEYGKIHTTSGTDTTETQSIDSKNPQTNFAGVDYAATMNRGQTKLTTNHTEKDNGSDKSTTTYGHVIDDTVFSDTKTTGQNTSNFTQNSENNRSVNEKINRNEKGFIGDSLSLELERYRKSFINIYEKILDECEELFMGIFSNPYMSGGGW